MNSSTAKSIHAAGNVDDLSYRMGLRIHSRLCTACRNIINCVFQPFIRKLCLVRKPVPPLPMPTPSWML